MLLFETSWSYPNIRLVVGCRRLDLSNDFSEILIRGFFFGGFATIHTFCNFHRNFYGDSKVHNEIS